MKNKMFATVILGAAVVGFMVIMSLLLADPRNKIMRLYKSWHIEGACFVELADPEPWEMRDPRLMIRIEENGKRGLRYQAIDCSARTAQTCAGIVEKNKVLDSDGFYPVTCLNKTEIYNKIDNKEDVPKPPKEAIIPPKVELPIPIIQ